ncbi:MAG: DUF3306 domain-containing protein [Rhodoferax sp.]|nr:DUF3306 domain-containing protein [Rhodoferax sp.]HQX57786.1 DUF3306 domain-containing protein [Burkholderiaceae bacterium]HRA62273.1 DUF3306 domain-containing protein [Burkholderiaceae bacterium]
MAEGFLGRWSQRKQAAREGKPARQDAGEEAPAAPQAPDIGTSMPPGTTASVVRKPPAASERSADATVPEPAEPQAPPPSMQDVAALHADSDFKPFVARAVAPEVRNAAMKKLFADPHFNVMDGLDTYIDDYSIPDPLPASMLRKMVSAQFLNLFDQEKPAQDAAPGANATEAAAPDTQAMAAAVAPDSAGPVTPEPADAAASDPSATTSNTTDPDKTDRTV